MDDDIISIAELKGFVEWRQRSFHPGSLKERGIPEEGGSVGTGAAWSEDALRELIMTGQCVSRHIRDVSPALTAFNQKLAKSTKWGD